MLHATCYNATVAPFIGGVITLIMGGLPARIVSVSELKESTFVDQKRPLKHKKTNIIFVTACVIRQKTLSLQHVFS